VSVYQGGGAARRGAKIYGPRGKKNIQKRGGRGRRRYASISAGEIATSIPMTENKGQRKSQLERADPETNLSKEVAGDAREIYTWAVWVNHRCEGVSSVG